MKKLIIALLLVSNITFGQIRFLRGESFNVSIAVDPSASIKEKSPNLVFEIEALSSDVYVKSNLQILPALLGGYSDISGGIGLNLTSGYFSKIRYYGGVRMGLIFRGFTEGRTYTYPLIGIEAGINHYISSNTFIGIRATGDYRSDFKYSGAPSSIRYSGFIKVGFNL